MATTHTPGPWRVNLKVNTSVEQATAPQGMVLICQCEDPDGARTNKEDAANARLIAAAPELLQCLKNAIAFIEVLSDDNDTDLVREIHATIAKAEGGANGN